jgi:hypothetical protein
MRDDDEGKPTQDSDRAAILARRKHFIALALSGLTTAAACTDGSGTPADGKTTQSPKDTPKEDPKVQPPQVCLSVMAEPQPCLSIAPPEPEVPEVDPQVPQTDPQPVEDLPQIPPNVCLKIARPPEDAPKPEPKPQPCLKKAPPQPG